MQQTANGKTPLTQIVRVMKISALLLILVFQAAARPTASAQVTLKEKGARLEKVLRQIKKQSDYGITYDDNLLRSKARPVEIDVNNIPVDEALKKVFAGQDQLTYAINGKMISVKEKKPLAVTESLTPRLEALPPLDISGRITNAQGEPMSGANVIIKRTGRGAIADANGKFILQEVKNDDVLIVSFIGYKTLNIKVGDRSNFTLIMDVAVDKLDEAIVQGYGKTTQRLATGTIGRITAEDIIKQPVINPLQALQGRIPGLVVSQTNGFGSAPIKVEIRGRNAIGNFPSDPLYIIDGVPLTVLDISNTGSYNNGSPGYIGNGFNGPAGGQSPFFSINPADIESIEVLKDADATAIYGSRGGNGVILITTKKSRVGKTSFDVNIYKGYSYVTNHWEMLSTPQYLTMRREAFKNDGLTANINNAPDLIAWDTTRYTDWQKYLWGNTGKTTDVQGILTAGNNQTNFRLSVDYKHQTSILAISGADQRAAVSFNLSHRSQDQHLEISLSNNYTYSQADMIFMPNAVTLAPNAPAIFDGNGKLNYLGWAPVQNRFVFGSLLQPYTSKTNFLVSSLLLRYEAFKGFYLKSSVGYTIQQTTQENFQPIVSQNPANNPKGSANFGANSAHTFIYEPHVEYVRFISKGKLNILAGGSLQTSKAEGLFISGSGYTNDALLGTISNAPNQFSTGNYGEYKYAALFARINYDWKSKYIVNLNARRDGSSRFGPGKQFGNFGSAGIAWIFTEEKWVKDHLSFISFGKLRGSYGITGSDQVPDYAYLTRWSTSGLATYNNILPLVPTQHADSSFQWQVNHKTEIALSVGFLKDRFQLEISRYRNRCDNQLVAFPLPILTGFANVVANSPANVENKGWEIVISGKIIELKNFKWSSNLNFAINRNKLISYPNISQSPYANTLVVGQPLNIRKLLHYTGVDAQTGLYTFEDKNKDGSISYNPGTNDDRSLYSFAPKFNGGFGNNFKYKNWDLSGFFYFIKQRGINALNSGGYAGQMNNQPVRVLDRWQKPGDITEFARFTTNTTFSASNDNFNVSDGAYTDASFIRLANLSLSYSLPQNALKKIGAKYCRIYMQGQNLFVITKYKGIDPETQNFGGMPPSKIVTAGISLTF